MAFSLLHVAIRALLGALVRSRRGLDVKDIELLVLRHELEVLRRQVVRPQIGMADRALLAAAAAHLPRPQRSMLSVTLRTLLRWHHALVQRKWRQPRGRVGRPPLPPEIEELALRLARANPRWGHRESAESCASSASTSPRQASGCCSHVRVSSRRPRRRGPSWREFLRAQAASIIACDFLTVETALLRPFYVLFFIAHASRRVPRDSPS